MRKRARWLIGIGLLVAAVAGGSIAVALAASPSNSAVEYSAPFICGWLPPVPPDLDQHAKPGDYHTAINVHNPEASSLVGSRRVSLSRRAGSPSPAVVPFNGFGVGPHGTLQIDCVDIWAMASLPPGTFVKGAVHIGVPRQVPVAAIYTSQTHDDPNAGPGPSAGHSVDVEQILPFSVSS